MNIVMMQRIDVPKRYYKQTCYTMEHTSLLHKIVHHGGIRMKSSRYTNPQDSPGYLLWHVTTMWQKEVRRVLEPLELTQPQFILLHACLWLNERDLEGKGITQVQIAQFANVDVNVTSQVLRTLEKRGYVTRARHQTDTRANIITTTPEGTRLAIEGMNLVEESDKNFFELLDDRKEEYMEIMQEFIRHKREQ